ncbi:unnamed protein product [Pieris macdunnoughi]|uniref:Uncharacterized protein n=1 Tax=Pieris macdunnoughi TaxID=345717 RepID=A0A821PGN3_9NEOP|nr:unnamed protein product [Pieris macdunnoughi]
MPELGTVMRAMELQRLIEDKVSEWRERSARVAGTSVADSYQQPLNFKRHKYRRKNSAEINRIIAKYSKVKRTDERHSVLQTCPEEPPVPPARLKKVRSKFSKSEDNLANICVMDERPVAISQEKSQFNVSKYNTKSCEDINAFVDVGRTKKSKLFEEKSILNTKATPVMRPKLHSISEDILDISDFGDSGVDLRPRKNFVTSTPLSNRKTCPVGDSVSVIDFEKCSNSVSDLKKGNSEPDIANRNSVDSSKTLDGRKRWSLLKPLKPTFRKGTLDCLIRWRGKKSQNQSK